jgi:kinesin family protein 15
MDDRAKLMMLNSKNMAEMLCFDYCAHESAAQDEIFAAVGRPITVACLEGYNSTVLCYGQTGSGKTHTMFGPGSVLVNLAGAQTSSVANGMRDWCASAVSPVNTDAGTALLKPGGSLLSGNSRDPARGLVPRCLEYLFAHMSRETRRSGGAVAFTCKCSFFEIFNERVFDLLDATGGIETGKGGGAQGGGGFQGAGTIASGHSNTSGLVDLAGLTVREDNKKGVFVAGLQEEVVLGSADAMGVVARGYRNRRVAETAMNRESSRSHAVFQLTVESTIAEHARNETGNSLSDGSPETMKRSRTSLFNLVDLAGSERQKMTKSRGDRLKEANSINKSLSAVGLVINALVDKANGRNRHVHYRDSKLTFLLRDSLGGNSRTVLVATVSPAVENYGETLSTLKFAQRAMMIQNTAVVNENTIGNNESLQREVARLTQELLKERALNKAHCASSLHDMMLPTSNASTSSSSSSSSSTRDELLLASLERFMDLHKRNARLKRQKLAAMREREQVEQALYAANLQLKLLRRCEQARNHEGESTESVSEIPTLDAHSRSVLAEVEQQLVKFPQVAKWRVAVDEMRHEIICLSGLDGVNDEPPSEADLGEVLTTDSRALDVLEALRTDKSPRVRDQVLCGNLGTQCWRRKDEADFQVELQGRFAKIVVEKEELSAELQAVYTQIQETHSSSRPSPSAGVERGSSDDFRLLFENEFGRDGESDGCKSSLDLIGGACWSPSSVDSGGAGRRSNGCRRNSFGLGGRIRRRGSSGWSRPVTTAEEFAAIKDANRKVRETEGKMEVLTVALKQKTLEVAELQTVKSKLEREKLELKARMSARSFSSEFSDSNSNVVFHYSPSPTTSPRERDENIVDVKADVGELKMLKIEQFRHNEAVKAKMATAVGEAERLQGVASQAEAAAAREEEAAAAAVLEAEELKTAMKAALKVAENAEAKAKQLEDALDTMAEAKEFLEAQATAQATAHTEQLAALRLDIEGKASDLASARGANDKATADALALQGELLRSAAAGTAEDARMARLQSQLAEQACAVAATMQEARDAERDANELSIALSKVERDKAALERTAAEAMTLHFAVVGDLQEEVASLRAANASLEADRERLKADLKSITDDRDEVSGALSDAEALVEQIKEELETEKKAFFEQMAAEAQRCQELEEALEAEQQTMIDAQAMANDRHKEVEKMHMEAIAALKGERDAAIVDGEAAFAEVAMLKDAGVRDASEAERGLLTARAELKATSKMRAEAAAALALAEAACMEETQKVSELQLKASGLEVEKANLVECLVLRDVELRAAQRDVTVVQVR